MREYDLRRDTLPDGWTVETGVWTPTPDGLVGAIEADSAAVVWTDARVPFDHEIRVVAEAIAPSDNDANAFFRAAGTIYGESNQSCWIVGNAGWYCHDDGLEKHPSGPTWRVPGKPIEGVIEFTAGVRDDVVYFEKNGVRLLERADPAPLDPATHDRVGLGTWDARIRFLSLTVVPL